MKASRFAYLLLIGAVHTLAADGELEFTTFESCELESGASISDCRIGYRTWGTLDEDRSNAVLLPTWFTGTSGDFERFDYVGDGKTADTSRWFVIAVDALGNGVSSSPSNASNKPFPDVTIGDMVVQQHRLLTEKLELPGLHGIIGISMGGMQAFDWVVRFPGFAGKAASITGTPWQTAWDRLHWNSQLDVIDALGNTPQAADIVASLDALVSYTPDYVAANHEAGDFRSFKAAFLADDAHLRLADRASQLRAMMAHQIDSKALIAADLLIVVSPGDSTVHPQPSRDLADRADARLIEFDGRCGHYDSVCSRDDLAPVIREFLAGQD